MLKSGGWSAISSFIPLQTPQYGRPFRTKLELAQATTGSLKTT